MAAYETLLVETVDTVGILTLNRPRQFNTFSTQLAKELEQALWALDDDRAVRVILLRGAGRNFCAGIDLSEMPGQTAQQYRRWIEHMERPLESIDRLVKPVIAQVQGVAAANGLGLVAACDLAVAADDARMGLTAIKVGMNCVGPVLPVARCVGRKRALELLYYGELIGASQALEWGLVNRVVPAAELEQVAMTWARELASRPSVALGVAKTAFSAAADMPYDKQFAMMNEAFARLCTTADAQEGVAAFLEKRPPQWRGE